MRFWIDGPRRSPEDVDPAVRGALTEMYRRALELQAPFYETVDEEMLVPDVTKRLAEIAVPTLVLVGEEGRRRHAPDRAHAATEIPGAATRRLPAPLTRPASSGRRPSTPWRSTSSPNH